MDKLYRADELHGAWGNPAQQDARLKELHRWRDAFAGMFTAETGEELPFSDEHLIRVNSEYWENMNQYVRKLIAPEPGDDSPRADRHKIASLMELMIVHVQPIQMDDNPDKQSRLNALFAFFVAKSIIGSWNPGNIHETMLVSKSFEREHYTWLCRSANNERMPIFCNAAVWYLVEKIYFERQDRPQSCV